MGAELEAPHFSRSLLSTVLGTQQAFGSSSLKNSVVATLVRKRTEVSVIPSGFAALGAGQLLPPPPRPTTRGSDFGKL